MADGGVWTKIYPDVASLVGGKVLQVVMETDTTEVRTTLNDMIPAGLSVSIAPKNADSRILLIAAYSVRNENSGNTRFTNMTGLRIVDQSGVAVPGAENMIGGVQEYDVNPGSNGLHQNFVLFGLAYAGVTTKVTYSVEVMHHGGSGVSVLKNDVNTAQLYAIELADLVVSP